MGLVHKRKEAIHFHYYSATMMIPLLIVFFCVYCSDAQYLEEGKIVGGFDTDISAYPYQLSLEYLGAHTCGAALIAPTWALTAAHCTDGTFSPFLAVRAGSSFRGRGGRVVGVKQKYQHERFSATTIDYDVALLELREPITGEDAEVVPLPTVWGSTIKTTPKEGALATITGWGTISENGRLSRVLKVVEVPVVNMIECRKAYAYANIDITERMFCAGYPEGGKDACQGDSGGPVIIDGELAGIVSWGFGCARAGMPGVYTNVAAVRDYIKVVTGI